MQLPFGRGQTGKGSLTTQSSVLELAELGFE